MGSIANVLEGDEVVDVPSLQGHFIRSKPRACQKLEFVEHRYFPAMMDTVADRRPVVKDEVAVTMIRFRQRNACENRTRRVDPTRPDNFGVTVRIQSDWR